MTDHMTDHVIHAYRLWPRQIVKTYKVVGIHCRFQEDLFNKELWAVLC